MSMSDVLWKAEVFLALVRFACVPDDALIWYVNLVTFVLLAAMYSQDALAVFRVVLLFVYQHPLILLASMLAFLPYLNLEPNVRMAIELLLVWIRYFARPVRPSVTSARMDASCAENVRRVMHVIAGETRQLMNWRCISEHMSAASDSYWKGERFYLSIAATAFALVVYSPDAPLYKTFFRRK